MKQNFASDKYWIIFGIVIIILTFWIYQYSPFQSADMKISRTEAEQIAKDYLSSKGVDISNYWVESFVNENSITNKYIVKELGNEGFEKLSKDETWNLFGWMVYFHTNTSLDIPQTTYTITISNHGLITSYQKQIPDATSIHSISKTEAEELMRLTITENLPIDLSEFELTESREENYSNRTDHSFRWKKETEFIEGELIVRGKIQGDQTGVYEYFFLVPENDRKYFDSSEALFGTSSVIFVAFLMVFALYYFLKKYHQGEVWITVGRTLFIIYFIIALISVMNVWPNLGQGTHIGNLSFVTVKIIIALLNGLFIQFLLALLVFASWAVGESFGREFWPEKLNGTDSIIRGHIFTISAGSGLMRGMVLGLTFAFVYLLSSIVINQPVSSLFISPVANFDMFYGYIPFISVVGEAFIDATLGGIVVTFFVVSLSFSRWRKKSKSILMVGLITVLANVIAATPPSINNFILNIVISFLFGLVIGYLYFKFDLLTILAALFYSVLTYNLFTLASSSANFYTYNTILVFAVFAFVPVVYSLGRMRKKEFVLENYGLPSHIEKISERERLKKELEIAAKVQLSLLPKEQPKIAGYEIASISIPAKEAGGDYYDFVKLSNGKIGIAIGDVSGKGVGAAIYMTLTKGILQAHAEENVSPKIVLGKVNRLLYKTIEKNSFVSMFYAILDVNSHSLLYSRAGHNPGIFCSSEKGDSKLLMSKGIALGLEEGKVFQETLTEDTIALKHGDVVVFYTDGFTEAMNEKLQLYGEEALIQLIQNNNEKHPNEILNLILKDVRKFIKDYPQHDDMTVVILKRL
ncbi:serine phosphatase rsbu, regulator of sigma subunit [hydrocarbon metagenome]|uniref:Serine phosphatase rsbu, regulator of sigma subunit n=1 Tax=hydrocarbon metagenome TaxID=938273 RepID=A0A0W8FXI2_9ZZZZ